MIGSGEGGRGFRARASNSSGQAESEFLDEANLFVGDLAKEVNEKELRDAFAEFGHVLGVDIKRDRVTGSSLGYGFVQFATRRCERDWSRVVRMGDVGRVGGILVGGGIVRGGLVEGGELRKRGERGGGQRELSGRVPWCAATHAWASGPCRSGS